MVNYREFRFHKLNTPQFSHLKLLLFWPIHFLFFMLLERVYKPEYNVVHCAFDDIIPFNEYFLIPYWFWFAFIGGMLIYLLLFDTREFSREMYFFMVTYAITLVIYIIYPTMQELRPTSFERQNLFTDLVSGLYEFDTNTNVCPSLHVIGTVAICISAFHTERFQHIAWKISFVVVTLLICASTVFLKQHSIIDVFCAIPVCVVGYFCAYHLIPKWTEKRKLHKNV